MFNFKNPVFSKLYRYYCAKLLTRIWTSLFWFLYVLVLLIFIWRGSGEWVDKWDGWTQKLALFWLISLIQLGTSWVLNSPLIGYLVGRESDWARLRRGGFGLPRVNKQNDVGVLLYTPGADRLTVIFAKFAAAFTYFMAFNFFISALLTVYFLTATSLGTAAAFSFLFLNGLFFGLINFCFLAPLIFYSSEVGTWLTYILIFALVIALQLILISPLQKFILQYPLVFCLLSIPFYFLTGYFFFSLYRKKVLTHDLA